ncbi:cysteine hydrolase [Tabrizicola sp. J26]|uniref:cysteine hydrolase family protein n=1 Tax=Alitabrizicola rongguiensis TaxID=2909234 RepID=UPI001F42E0C0|nr:cysteine hydrolase family protein [Tabrizicola rongguiensis]MCF1707374.1 cysteine hydrolase [Tabrizicola rongguiensis]
MTTALLVIDMQMEMAHRTTAGRERANPQAEDRVAELLALFRERGLPVIHVHHNEPGTPVAFGQPGGEVMPCALPLPGEKIFVKSRSSAFAGTGLDDYLNVQGIDRLVLTGAVAAFCVTSTTRAASDLGYQVILPGDSLIGFDIPRPDGSRIPADALLDMTLTILGADFARVLPTDMVARSI